MQSTGINAKNTTIKPTRILLSQFIAYYFTTNSWSDQRESKKMKIVFTPAFSDVKFLFRSKWRWLYVAFVKRPYRLMGLKCEQRYVLLSGRLNGQFFPNPLNSVSFCTIIIFSNSPDPSLGAVIWWSAQKLALVILFRGQIPLRNEMSSRPKRRKLFNSSEVSCSSVRKCLNLRGSGLVGD